ncbi:type II toxin-antitoxin system RelE/ParE family toxin [Corynebacterium aquatimens]|uniref:type II toxin-antitoxin system RelE/ParE family toxin n=1 Tax=Corynebacterium TaxID=1716 RepID=UPI001F468D73|nr:MULTISPECIES: type II toxin-antitoxin system RelE/ParE family toxin [Corynebacterium]QYH19624.1 type II toxin-antitoxin system RelE/ParE family toxin [Corynebacterium aquatimens]UIZ91393.1 type II toxin-antitoxin system RelE/ParE family toxin [Corynebacterium sp. CNCTC7651]
MSFRLKEEAVQDLREIWTYSADNWGADQADNYIRAIEGTIREVAKNPEKGKSTPLLPGFNWLSVRRHVIFYGQDEEGVVIVRILHQRMDPSLHL